MSGLVSQTESLSHMQAEALLLFGFSLHSKLHPATIDRLVQWGQTGPLRDINSAADRESAILYIKNLFVQADLATVVDSTTELKGLFRFFGLSQEPGRFPSTSLHGWNEFERPI
eukprot:gb/GECG01015918.1/.p1 GENE.gb/GECG01015918.1/~~gb/GECG01015918.1/.p1  ORF type:complete len:114 (+),score=5.27 gb/GECG01015918.1/:1-342(+)